MKKAIIYTRVSTGRQAKEGHSLQSQERSCRKRATEDGFEVVRVFNDEGVSGGILERPSLIALLKYLDEQKGKIDACYVFDIDRLARDVRVHIEVKSALLARGAQLISVNQKLEDTPEGKLMETMQAAFSEHFRNKNKANVIQKMKDALRSGRWPFCAPPGYENIKDEKGHKIVIPKDPFAGTIRELFEGFASGKIPTQEAGRKFLQAAGFRHKWSKSVQVNMDQVKRILKREFYAGWVVCEDWGIRERGIHEPIVSDETFTRVQERLAGTVRSFTRKDERPEFPLRRFVEEEETGAKFNASFSTGRTGQKYAYYHAQPKGRRHIRIKKDELEKAFCEKLKEVGRPTQQVVNLFSIVLEELVREREQMALESTERTQEQCKLIDGEILKLTDLAAKTTSDVVRLNYEKRIEKTVREKEDLGEANGKSESHLEVGNIFERGQELLKNPLKVWVEGNLQDRITVQRLAFRGGLKYSTKNKFGNSKISIVYSVLADSDISKEHLVEVARIELASKKLKSKHLQT